MTAAAPDPVPFRLDGRELLARAGETILQAARRHGLDIPHLCYTDGLGVAGNCRCCLVEIEGERGLAAACHRPVEAGMVVASASPRARAAQRGVLELLLAEAGGAVHRRDSELERWAAFLGARRDRFARTPTVPEADLSHPAIAVEHAVCIRCTRCVRACRDIQGHGVLGMAARASDTHIAFDLGDPMGESSCVGCGECVQACPTGALAPAGGGALLAAERSTDTVCPYCGVGCQVRVHVRGDAVLRVEGRDGPSNRGRLCVKGRFGLDYVRHPERLTRPLIRIDGAPKDPERLDEARAWFREADWEEALALAAGGLARIRDEHGPRALAGFGSAKGSNEEAYLFQKLVRLAFGNHNVDHCTRLCHASSVAALLEGIGSGAVSNQIEEVLETEVILLVGANPAANHPVAATFLRNAARAGATLIVADPRRTPLAREARHFLRFRPGTDVALFNAMLHTVIHEDLVDHDFVRERVEGFDALAAHLAPYSPERMAAVCGVDPGTIREVARTYARARRAMILWGMGVSQHTHGTDNVRCLIALALVCGHIGRRGTGLHPLRGQNNVQGASDAGLIPMMLPGYAPVADPAARARFERLWGARLAAEPGLTVVEILDAAARGLVRGMYIVGENPAMSDPNLAHAREGLARLEHLVVQDLFLTETAALADVVLPASALPEKLGTYTNTDRRIQLGRPALPLPGEARQDLWIITEMGRRLGLPWRHAGPQAVYEEMRAAMPALAGVPWTRLEREGAVTTPCPSEDHPGHGVLFADGFPLPGGRARLVPVAHRGPVEPPDAERPFVLITGRILEHWHTGAMTRRARVLDRLEPRPVVFLHPQDLADLGASPGEAVTVATRRGRVRATARPDPGLGRREVFMPFCYREAAANLLTVDALDPWGKIPEFKCCAASVRLASGSDG